MGVRGAIVYLVHPGYAAFGYEEDAVLSAKCLHKFFLSGGASYPVVVFHTQNVSKAILTSMRQHIDKGSGTSEQSIRFVSISFDFPSEIEHRGGLQALVANGTCHAMQIAEGQPGWGCACGCPRRAPNCWFLDYLHMNVFFTRTMFAHPALSEFDYVMRVDVDVFLQRPLVEDPFKIIAGTEGCVLLTDALRSEMPGCYDGLGDAARRILHSSGRGEAARRIASARGRDVVWGGWHLVDLQFFRRAETQHLVNALVDEGGIYTHRWSDQLIYPLAAQAFDGKVCFHK